MKFLKSICIILFFTVSAGCATTYKQPKNSSTVITFKMADDLNHTANQFYSIYPSPSCEEKKGYGRAVSILKMMGIGGNDKTVKVPPEKPIYILAEIEVYPPGGNIEKCRNFLTFTPRKGNDYIVQQKKSCSSVSVFLSDGTTKLDSANMLFIPNSCQYQ